MVNETAPVLPDYAGACVTAIVPTLLDPSGEVPAWMPQELVGARQSALLVIDGLGWDQLEERAHLAPTLASLPRTAITTVCPTTTATGLTPITTGLAPGACLLYTSDAADDLLFVDLGCRRTVNTNK